MKVFRFRGRFNCVNGMNAHIFPFDMQRLPFRIKAKPLPDIDGNLRKIRLREPVLRPVDELIRALDDKLSGSLVHSDNLAGGFHLACPRKEIEKEKEKKRQKREEQLLMEQLMREEQLLREEQVLREEMMRRRGKMPTGQAGYFKDGRFCSTKNGHGGRFVVSEEISQEISQEMSSQGLSSQGPSQETFEKKEKDRSETVVLLQFRTAIGLSFFPHL